METLYEVFLSNASEVVKFIRELPVEEPTKGETFTAANPKEYYGNWEDHPKKGRSWHKYKNTINRDHSSWQSRDDILQKLEMSHQDRAREVSRERRRDKPERKYRRHNPDQRGGTTSN